MPREKRTFTRISGVRNPSLIVIASEGRKTELKWPTWNLTFVSHLFL